MAEDGIYAGQPEKLTRRQLIRKGMVAAGLALWSAPVVAVGLAHSNRDKREPERQEDRVTPMAQTSSCGGMGSGDPCVATNTFCGTVPVPGGEQNCVCATSVTGECVCIQTSFGFRCVPGGSPCLPGSVCVSGLCRPLC